VIDIRLRRDAGDGDQMIAWGGAGWFPGPSQAGPVIIGALPSAIQGWDGTNWKVSEALIRVTLRDLSGAGAAAYPAKTGYPPALGLVTL